jgi:hypothetical protein
VQGFYLPASTEELIAPSCLEFFDFKWHKLGTKTTLRQQIADITRINVKVLDGESPAKRTIAERMSWASERATSRIEDVAYSLMGIFDVYLPMLYGEGDRAFVRLQEEIMKRSEDYTIFAWRSKSSESSSRGLFARSPSEFTRGVDAAANIQTSRHVLSQYKVPDRQMYDPAALTSRGLLITLPLLKENALESNVTVKSAVSKFSRNILESSAFFGLSSRPELKSGLYLALICKVKTGKTKEDQIMCIWLRKATESGMFTRTSPETVTILPGKRTSDFKMHTIYARPFKSIKDGRRSERV